MKKISECSACGHVTTIFSHHLNQPMINALRQLVDFCISNLEPASLQKDLNLTKNQYNNFQKLRYFRLVFKHPLGGWFPTKEGVDFIYGDIAIANRVATLNNSPLPEDHEYWKQSKSRPELKFVWEISEISYKKREEYKQEKNEQLKLLEI